MLAIKLFDKSQSEGSAWEVHHKSKEQEINQCIRSGIDSRDTGDVLDALLQDDFVRRLMFVYAFQPESRNPSLEVTQMALGKLVWQTINEKISELAATHADRAVE